MKTKASPSSGMTILIFGLLWAVTYVGCLLIVKELHPVKSVGLICSFLPFITFAFFIYHFISGIKAMDEVERTIQLEASVVAFALTLLMIMILGLLEHVVILSKDDWSYRHLVHYVFIFYLIGLIISRRKYVGDEKHD